jgi:hypothetical protein
MKFPTPLPSNLYRDPAIAFEQAESRTCKGCSFLQRDYFGTEKLESCAKGRRVGQRCKYYAV